MKIFVVIYFALFFYVAPNDYYEESSDTLLPNCDDSEEFDFVTFECVKKMCPINGNGTYPHCECTEKNFDYSAESNICFQVCPENSNGYFPNCICDDTDMGFVIESFECVTCPAEAKIGVHYNCDCSEIGTYNSIQNTCEKCMDGSSGIYPNCKCDDENAVYNKEFNRCDLCPIGSSGKIPNCVCPDGQRFYFKEHFAIANVCDTCDGLFENGYCIQCPFGSKLLNESCVCDGDAKFVKAKNACLTCPKDSTGIYPKCTCVDKTLGYNLLKNECSKCPQNASGIYPDCKCAGPEIFSLTHNECMACPSNSEGVYPKCQCLNDDQIFTAYLNRCYIPCPSTTNGLFHPNCTCDEDNYYDEIERNCKSNVGRECPKYSIGIGPNCHCIEEGFSFNKLNNMWKCSPTDSFFHFSAEMDICPDPTQRYPNCDVSINKHALFLLVGG